MNRIVTAVELFVDTMNDRQAFIAKAITKGFSPTAAPTYWEVIKHSTSPHIKAMLVQAKSKWYKTFAS